MTTALLDDSSLARRPRGGGIAARRAVIRWAWRLFRSEWRQQLLVLGLIVVAVAATILGGAVATNTPPPANAGFGSATDRAVYDGTDPRLATEIATLQHRFGAVDVIADETLNLPGSVDTYELRAQNPAGTYGTPMLGLLAGHYPTAAGQVGLTKGLESAFHVAIGGIWHVGAAAYTVVGTVRDPQNLLSEFALVAPGQVNAPTQVIALFDAHGVGASTIGKNVQAASGSKYTNPINPETLSLAGLVLGMLLIALVAVGGFTVLAQRRLRSLGMLASLGATDSNISLVVRANGAVVGIAGALIGALVGFAGWLAYRPHLQTSVHHVIGVLALPWLVVGLAVGLAVVATYLAARVPARSITRVPVVTALMGRPAPPRQIHRSALPGLVFLGVAFVLLGIAGSSAGNKGANAPALLIGLVALIPGVILLSPFALSTLARASRRAPITVRLALRDLARYRARSGSALSAIGVTILISSIIVIVAALRYGNALDYAGPNLSSHQLALYPASQNRDAPPGIGKAIPASKEAQMRQAANAIASSLGTSTVLELQTTSASLLHNAAGRNWNGQVFVATPQLLHAYGISASQITPGAQILTMRSGLSGLSKMQLTWGSKGGERQTIGPAEDAHQAGALTVPPCNTANECQPNPVIQKISALPSGTSAPNTVITESAVQQLHLRTQTSGWLIQTSQAPTATQINAARLAAANSGLFLEKQNDEPSSSEVINAATGFGIALALAILAMTVGLIRSETASDLSTLTATGASSRTRRSLTAATAGGLALLGALLGTVAGYIAVIGFIRNNSLNGGISSLANVPVTNLLAILLGMPLAATMVGWLLAGREPAAFARKPLG